MRLLVLSIIFTTALIAACGQEETPTPASYFDGTITLALEAPSEVRQGEQLTGLDVVMTNKGRESFSFYFSGNALDFVVMDDKGEPVWKYLSFWVAPLGRLTLVPGESKVLSELEWSSRGQWDLRDLEGFSLEPGEYQIKGVVTLSLRDDPGPDTSKERLETSAHTLTIREAPLPEYAQAIRLELTAPSEAHAGELVPMDMRITNTGDEPVILWWSGDRITPRPNDADIVIFREDTPIWRATSAHGVEYQGTMTLEPGESLAMSNMSFSYLFSSYKSSGEPWMWDQIADCGDRYRFKPCDEPVGPGMYTVRGVVNISSDETSERITIATEPHLLVISP